MSPYDKYTSSDRRGGPSPTGECALIMNFKKRCYREVVAVRPRGYRAMRSPRWHGLFSYATASLAMGILFLSYASSLSAHLGMMDIA
jgi:hypothetical protein